MNKLKILTGLLLFSAISLFSQDVDSLFSLYTESNREKQIELANEIAQTVYDLQCTDTLFRITTDISNQLSDAIVNELMASYAMYITVDYERSNQFTLQAALLYEALGDTLSADVMYGNMANNYLRMGQYEQAIELLLQCYGLEEKMNDREGLSFTLNSLGVAYSRWGETQTAIEYFRRSLEVESPLNRPMQYATRLASLSKEYMTLGEYGKALSFIQEALSYDEKIERKEREERIALHLTVLGDIYVEMDSLSQAGRCYDQAIGTFISNKQNNRLAEIYFSMGRLSMKKGDFNRAIELLEQSVVICEAHNMRQLLHDSYRLLYEVSRQKQPVSQTLIYLERYKALGDSLFQETTWEQLSEFRVRYDTQQKELEIVRQQAEIDKHQARQYLYIGGLVIAGILLTLFIYIANLRMKRNKVLAEMNATKDKFFSIISHDLKNPAIAQRDALQQLITYADKWDTESLSLYYEELLKSADGQVELLYNLLNWTQVQTGRMPYHPTEFDLTSELRSDIALIKNMADRKGITLDVRMPETAIITGDRNMMTTIVRNLLTNAVKFTGKGGCVTLAIQPDESDSYTISVTDTGTGMSKEQVDALFRIDRQRSRTGTAGESGSGLGLIVCKELVEKHGSILYVKSEKEKGSEFLFAVRKEGR